MPRIPHPFFNLILVSVIAKFKSADAIVSHNFPTWHKKSLVFIHDFIYIEHPEWFTLLERIYLSGIRPLVSIFAKKVFTSSNTEKIRISKYLHKPIYLAPLGVRTSLKEAIPQKPQISNVIQTPYILSVGRDNPRKNLLTLIDAYVLLANQENFPSLIIVGEIESEHYLRLIPISLRDKVLILNQVTDNELSWLYRNCQIFSFLSLDEGFGLPVLEALYFNCTLLLSDIKVFREISKGKAEFVNPMSSTEVSSGIIRVLADGNPKLGYLPKEIFAWTQSIEKIRSEIIEP